jgi:hypothetical protein
VVAAPCARAHECIVEPDQRPTRVEQHGVDIEYTRGKRQQRHSGHRLPQPERSRAKAELERARLASAKARRLGSPRAHLDHRRGRIRRAPAHRRADSGRAHGDRRRPRESRSPTRRASRAASPPRARMRSCTWRR